jgi:cysteine synthase
MQVYDSLAEVTGGTPLVRLQSVTRGIAATRNVLVKVEYLNPGGSVKDRIALRMIESAERQGKIAAGGTIIEPTSGNTGVGLAIVANNRGYKCVFVCPDKVAQDKISVLRAYGADVVVCPSTVSPDHPDSYYSVARRLARETPGAWQPDQYANPDNPAAHYHSTGPEIWAQTEGKITHLVVGIGTGGTISGTGRYLKDKSGNKVRVIGADLLAARDNGTMPALVHIHPEETVAQAIALLREYDVSQLPVVGQEPPLMAAEVAGAVAERDLLDALVAVPPLPVVGQGEPVSRAAKALETAGAALVHVDGKPAAVLTRQDLLAFYASTPYPGTEQ